RQLVMTRRPDAVLEGLDELNTLIQLSPDFAPGHAWLAYGYLFSSQFSGRPIAESITAAELHVRRAMELDPEDADPLTAAALLELFRRDPESALEFANRAIAANPNHVPALRRRGVIYLNLGQARKAHDDFLAVRARDPLSPITLAHVADTYAIFNDKANAVQAVSEAVRWNPDDAIANGQMGRILADTGEYVDALRYMERAVEINPKAALSTLGLSALYWQVGLDDRLDFAEVPMAWIGLAAAAMSAGEFDRGLQLAETHGTGFTSSLVDMHIFHWNDDPQRAYAPAMRLAARDHLAGSGLSDSYRQGAIPALLALEANGDPQAVAIRENLASLFHDKEPGDYAFGRDIYGAASWHIVNGNSDESLAWLQHAMNHGFIFRALHLDPIWAPVRETTEFKSILMTSDEHAESVRAEYLAAVSALD
ncbi:MAG: tetratricopeptide repeat protein, partial [Xanthomonadales bacterium]|nr:tetratricopeptide repeat protein [Xanthomonadales bacterium]